jgi:hypothetical protein
LALTGLPLLLVCLLATGLAVGLTIVGWRRGGRARIVVWIVLEPSVYDWLSGWLAAPERGPVNRGE